MLVLMLGALALALRKRHVGAGALWVMAGAVKAPALLLVPLQLACGRRRLWLGVGLTAVAGSIAASALFGSAWLTALGRIGRHEARYAIPVRLEQFGVPDALAHLLALAVLLLGALWLFRQARNGRPRLALGACLLVLTTPWLLPWYATWPIALAAVEDDVAAQILAVAVAAYLLPARVPF